MATVVELKDELAAKGLPTSGSKAELEARLAASAEAPEAPAEAPDAPEAPAEAPDAPEAPAEAPDVPDVPDVPDEPSTPDVPEETPQPPTVDESKPTKGEPSKVTEPAATVAPDLPTPTPTPTPAAPKGGAYFQATYPHTKGLTLRVGDAKGNRVSVSVGFQAPTHFTDAGIIAHLRGSTDVQEVDAPRK